MSTHFKIHLNDTPLAGIYSGPSTGLPSAMTEYNKRLRHLEAGTIKIVAYEGDKKITIISATK